VPIKLQAEANRNFREAKQLLCPGTEFKVFLGKKAFSLGQENSYQDHDYDFSK
jgi:hypothetical protein